jgi:plasmid stabilization system protein ParE
MRYSLHPGAREDLREAAGFYWERGGNVLAQAVLAEFERNVDLLLRHPKLGILWRYGKRRRVMNRFPYALIYTVQGEEIRILAVAHHSRRPAYWRRRK